VNILPKLISLPTHFNDQEKTNYTYLNAMEFCYLLGHSCQVWTLRPLTIYAI
jgi:hypothetical protein